MRPGADIELTPEEWQRVLALAKRGAGEALDFPVDMKWLAELEESIDECSESILPPRGES